jgi:hypothetical protein
MRTFVNTEYGIVVVYYGLGVIIMRYESQSFT